MTTTITRDQMRPGQIVQRVTTQTYRVCKRAGLLKLDQLPPFRAEWQLVRGTRCTAARHANRRGRADNGMVQDR